MYNSLKAQVMATHVANAAGEEVDHTMQSIRQSDRFVDKLPGIRSGTVYVNQPGTTQQHGIGQLHNRAGSGSSGSSGHQRLGSRLQFDPQLQSRIFGGRNVNDRTLQSSQGLIQLIPMQDLCMLARHKPRGIQVTAVKYQ